MGFPEFTRYLSDVNTELASAILHQYPIAQAFREPSPRRLARLNYDGRHLVGEELARKLIDAAKVSVGSQHSQAHQTGVRYACEDLQTLRKRLKQLAVEISSKLEQHQVSKLLTTIAGIGDNTAAYSTNAECAIKEADLCVDRVDPTHASRVFTSSRRFEHARVSIHSGTGSEKCVQHAAIWEMSCPESNPDGGRHVRWIPPTWGNCGSYISQERRNFIELSETTSAV